MAGANWPSGGGRGTGGNARGRGYSGPGGAAASPGSMEPSSLSRRGADFLKPLDSGRPQFISPTDMNLLARTHGGNFSSAAAGGGRRPRSNGAASMWSMPSSMGDSQSTGFNKPDRGASCSTPPGNDKRFYMTAPARQQICSSSVEEATGVRLSKDQLQALRKRYQGGHSRLGESGGFGEKPSGDALRNEVFGSIVLKPGQWPKLGGSSVADSEMAPRQGNAQRMGGGSTSLPAAPNARQGGGRQLRGRGA